MNHAVESVVDVERSEKSSHPRTSLNLAIGSGERSGKSEKSEKSINDVVEAILNVESSCC